MGNQFTTNKQRGGQTGANWNSNGGRRNDHKILYEVRSPPNTVPHRSMPPTAARVLARGRASRTWIRTRTSARQKWRQRRRTSRQRGSDFPLGRKRTREADLPESTARSARGCCTSPTLRCTRRARSRPRRSLIRSTSRRAPRRAAAPHRCTAAAALPPRRDATPPHCHDAARVASRARGHSHLHSGSRQVTTNPGKKGYGGSTPGTLFGPGPSKVLGPVLEPQP